jgi:TfoX/Sxy family transcriptional regulator of competence genes
MDRYAQGGIVSGGFMFYGHDDEEIICGVHDAKAQKFLEDTIAAIRDAAKRPEVKVTYEVP